VVEHLPGVTGKRCHEKYTHIYTLEESQVEIWDTEAVMLCQHRPSGLSPKDNGVSPYIPLQAGYRSKKQGLIHIWLYTILLATLPLCYVTFFLPSVT
jgi:hypothetical protein